MRTGRTPVLVVTGLSFLLGLVWLVSNPPGAAPDETSHYVRMVGLAHGSIMGSAFPADYPVTYLHVHGVMEAHLRYEAGVYRIPGDAPPPNFCNRGGSGHPYDCDPQPTTDVSIVAESYHAKTLPTTYLVPALLSRLGGSTNSVLYLGRLGFLLEDVLLVFVIGDRLRVVADRRWWRWACAMMLAFTPLLAFEMGTLAPNGTETLAIVAFAAALLAALHRGRRSDVVLATVLGCVALLCRESGLTLVPTVGLLVLLIVPGSWRTLRGWGTRRLLAMGLPLSLALGAASWWHERFSGPLGTANWSWPNVRHLLWLLVFMGNDSVGRVGSLDVRINPWFGWVWLALLAALAVEYLLVSRRTWWWLPVALGGWVALNLLLSVELQTVHYTDQGRYTLAIPAAAAVCLASVVIRERQSRQVAGLMVVVAVFTSYTQLATIVVNGDRHARGLDRFPITFASPVWSPPIGWTATIVLAVAVCGGLAAVPLWAWWHDRTGEALLEPAGE